MTGTGIRARTPSPSPAESSNLLASAQLTSPQQNRDISSTARGRGPKTVTAAEKAQAHEVSLSRIGRLSAPYVWQLAIVTAVTSAFGVIQTWISTKVGQQVMHGLRTSVFAHLQRHSMAFFTRTRTGEVQSRITNDIGGMESVVTSTATSIAANFTTAIATAVAMAALSWRLSLISLVVMPPAIYLTRKVARMRRAITTQQQRELADLNVTIEEGLSVSGIQLAKTMGTGPALIERFTASSARLIDLELRSQLAGRWRMASLSIIFAAIPAIIYYAAVLPGTAGKIT